VHIVGFYYKNPLGPLYFN